MSPQRVFYRNGLVIQQRFRGYQHGAPWVLLVEKAPPGEKRVYFQQYYQEQPNSLELRRFAYDARNFFYERQLHTRR